MARALAFAASASRFFGGAVVTNESRRRVTMAVTSTTVLTVHPSLPVKSVSDLVDLVRSNPAKLVPLSCCG